ncbi:hypothetical protein Trydic_g9641 [Trypoxylus dichotomus]
MFPSLLLLSSLAIFSTSVNISNVNHCGIVTKSLPNYYWRKYEGVIPNDAIPGGHTPTGENTYIGQTLVINDLQFQALTPGVIYIGKPEVEVTVLGHVYKGKHYNAILCSDTPSALKWRGVCEDDFPLIHNYLVVGGYVSYLTAYIGRASHNNYLIPGKVYTDSFKGLRIASANGTEVEFSTFEVLVYDPSY